MSKSQPLLAFYSQLLESLNIHDTGDGHLSLKVPNEDGDYSEIPCLSNDKRLVLPTDAILRAGSLEGMLAFHPLSENLLRGESETIKFLRKMVKFRLASVGAQLLAELMAIAADPERHQELSPRQAEYLTAVPNANDKTMKAMSKVLRRHFDELINIYLKRDAYRGEDHYRRLAAVSFPIWDELSSPGSKIYEVDCGSAKNKKTVAALFEFVFPHQDNPAEWSVGSNSGTAPYFDALIKCYANLGRHLSKLVYKYRKHLEHADLLRSDLDWIEAIEDLDKWKTLIPPLPGNEGAVEKGTLAPSEKHAPTKTPNFAAQAASVASQQSSEAPEVDTPPWEEQPSQPAAGPMGVHAAKTPTPAPAPQPAASTGHGISWRDAMRARTAGASPGYPTYPQPHQGGYPQQQNWGQPAAQPTQSHWGQPAPAGPAPAPAWGGGGSSL